MAQARGEQTVVGECVGIARESLQHFLIVRISFREAAICDQRASGGLLQGDAAGVDSDCASERSDGLIVLATLCFGAGDALLDEAIVGIESCSALQRGEISFVGAQREMELVEAAPEKQQRRERNSDPRSG